MNRVLIALFITTAAFAAVWNDYNDPATFGEVFNYKFGALSASAALPVIPWTDNYWPSSDSGLAYRWNAYRPESFKYKLLTEAQVRNASQTVLRSLSPAEKYDIFMGRFDYPLVHSEWLRTHPTDAGWEGLCHGWAPAAGFYTEPGPLTIKSANGIEIEFGSADVKGLLTYFNAEYVHTNSYFLSQRCEYDLEKQPNMGTTDECADMNAATLHLVLTNQISMGKFFVADVDRGYAVWNQPVFKYSYTVNGYRNATTGAATGTVREVSISNTMTYARESQQQWRKHGDNPVTYRKYYDYWLELDANDNIVGGSWVSDERSDFAWKNAMPQWSGYFKSLGRIFAISINLPDPGANVTSPIMAMASQPIKPNHKVLNNNAGSFAISNYASSHSESWTISPKKSNSITLSFPSFSTKRYLDKVKIYEGADGQGPLLAVLHGDSVPKSLKFDVKSLLVTFTSDRQSSGAGFRINYKAQ